MTTTNEYMDVADFLEKTADLLQAGGVCKGQFSKANGDGTFAHCVLGAMHTVTENLPRTQQPRATMRVSERMLLAHVREKFGDVRNIPTFNDSPNRKASTIIKAVRDTAAKAQAL